MGKLFGTDGIRGEANVFLTPELAFSLGKAAAWVLRGAGTQRKAFIIGKDTRISGDMLEAALAAGICSMGVDVYKLGVCPTPAVAYLTKKMDFTSGIMISASHNPAIDNGIKFFDHDGFKLPDETEEKIESLLQAGLKELPPVPGDQVGRIYEDAALLEQYKSFLLESFPLNLSGITMVLDCANGSASYIMPEILQTYGGRVLPICNQPDGININKGCGSTHLERVRREVLLQGADMGIAHDGDSDRVLFVDDLGNEVDGDMVMALVAEDLKSRNKLPNDLLVGTVMSNLGLKKYLEARNIRFIEAKVGDRYVLEEMLRNQGAFGGEQSGHLIFLDYNTTGDGILTALLVLELMQRKGKSLRDLLADYRKFPQVLENVRVGQKNGWETNLKIRQIIAEKEQSMGDAGRILVRASGTENLIRVMVEGAELEEIQKMALEIAQVVAGELA